MDIEIIILIVIAWYVIGFITYILAINKERPVIYPDIVAGLFMAIFGLFTISIIRDKFNNLKEKRRNYEKGTRKTTSRNTRRIKK